MSQQGLRQASVRAVTGTTLTHDGDWHALWDQGGIAEGTFNGRMLLWLNDRLSAGHDNLNDAMAAFAAEEGATNFSSVGTFNAAA